MTEDNELVFEEGLDLRSIPVKIKRQDGDYDNFVLYEIAGEADIVWRNSQVRAAKLSPDGQVIGMGDVAEADTILLSKCLARIGVDKEFDHPIETPIPLVELRKWPDRILSRLTQELLKISDKEDQPATKEDLQKQIVDLQARLDRIIEREQAEKNSWTPTTNG